MSDRPPLPDPPYRGGCLCGRVRYTYAARPLAVNACHCTHCKRMTGADYLKMLLGLRAEFTREQGETQIYRKTADSGRQVDVHRCAECGTRLYHEPLSSPALIFIAVGTLDQSRDFVPTSHIWVEQAGAGVAMAADAMRIEGQPAAREMLMYAFKRVYGDE